MLEVFVDDYISLVVPTPEEKLCHARNGAMHGIHDFFHPDDDNEDPGAGGAVVNRTRNGAGTAAYPRCPPAAAVLESQINATDRTPTTC